MSDQFENIILLSADALRADHMSCYGYERKTSPSLDKLAEKSIIFRNAYSASSHTREAVPALLTGEYPDMAIDSQYQLAAETIATALSERGYSTGGFHSNPFISRAYGFDQGFDVFDDDLHLGQHKLIALAQRALDKLRNRHYARANEINSRSLDWIDSLDSGPFFLWNHYMDTHGPYEPPHEYAKVYNDYSIQDRRAQSLYQRAIDKPDSITDEERERLIDLYDGEIRYNDEYIGKFIEALRDRDLLQNTLLIFTADHGDAFDENGYYEHPRYLHKEITHVPMIVHTPSSTGKIVDTPVSTVDIGATIRHEILGQNAPSLLDGFENNRRVFSQARGEGNDSNLRRYAIRTESEFALCEHNRNTDEIQFSNVSERALRQELESHVENRKEVTTSEQEARSDNVDEEIERRLNALGYKE